MSEFIAAGHICLDITPVFPHKREYPDIGALLRPGKLLHMDGVRVHTGGSAANTGLAMKKLGADVRLLSKIGDDELGALITQIAASHGVGGLIVDPESTTSYSVVLAVPGHDRIFLHDPGANDSFCSDDVPDEALDGARLFHFGYPPLMRRMYENGGEQLYELFRRVKERGVATSLDMAAVDPDSDEGRADWRGILTRVLPLTDYFEPSLDETRFMLQRPDAAPAALVRELRDMGAGTVLLKCGTEGMYYSAAEGEGHQPCFPVSNLRSATGAGDVSIGTFLVSIMQGRSVRESAALAAAQGAFSVRAYDALSSLGSLEELEETVNAGKPQRDMCSG